MKVKLRPEGDYKSTVCTALSMGQQSKYPHFNPLKEVTESLPTY